MGWPSGPCHGWALPLKIKFLNQGVHLRQQAKCLSDTRTHHPSWPMNVIEWITGFQAWSPKNYKGSNVLFHKNKGKIKVQRGQRYNAQPWMSGIHSALEWWIQTPATVLTYWTIKIFDLYQWPYDDKVYFKDCCISQWVDNNDFYL